MASKDRGYLRNKGYKIKIYFSLVPMLCVGIHTYIFYDYNIDL